MAWEFVLISPRSTEEIYYLLLRPHAQISHVVPSFHKDNLLSNAAYYITHDTNAMIRSPFFVVSFFNCNYINKGWVKMLL